MTVNQFPLTPTSVLSYAMHEFNRGIAYSTFDTSLSSITTYNSLAGYDDISAHLLGMVKRSYKKLYNEKNPGAKEAPFLSSTQFLALLKQSSYPLTTDETLTLLLLYLFGLRPSSFSRPIELSVDERTIQITIHFLKKQLPKPYIILRPVPSLFKDYFPSSYKLTSSIYKVSALCTNLRATVPGLHPKAFRSGLVTVGRAVGVKDLWLQRILKHVSSKTLDCYTYPYTPNTDDEKVFQCLIDLTTT